MYASIDIKGIPASKGSYRAINVKGKTRFIPMDRKEKPWRKTVSRKLQELWDVNNFDTIGKDQFVSVTLTFFMPRPKQAKRMYPTVKPDIDKLTRCILDAITDSGIWVDDSQCTRINAEKIYAQYPEQCGVFISISWRNNVMKNA